MSDYTRYEKALLAKGINYIAGVDEVGRGPLAGPLVVCALIFDSTKLNTINDAVAFENSFYSQIKDSKLLTSKKRSELADKLHNEVLTYSIVTVEHFEIDEIGVGKATQRAFAEAVKNLRTRPEHVLTDMFAVKGLPKEDQTNIKRGDRLSITVAAASIMAKVYRDQFMIKMHEKFPVYGFDTHKGYGTRKHIEMLIKHGPCAIHRRSFEPLKSLFASA